MGENSYTVNPDTIKLDLTKERPQWILSSYAPGKDPPAQLIDNKDISPEEMRLQYYTLGAQGQLGAYVWRPLQVGRVETDTVSRKRSIKNSPRKPKGSSWLSSMTSMAPSST